MTDGISTTPPATPATPAAGTARGEATRDRRELILYATPIGPLAEAIDRYNAAVAAELTPTAAQAFPPHCTLTGFFQRDDHGAARAIEQVDLAVIEAGTIPDEAVEVVGLVTDDRWVGLELRSPWLIEFAAAIAERLPPGPDDDAIRLKDWLHLSLAYGAVDDLTGHAALASQMVDPRSRADWEVALWERRPGGAWTRLTIGQQRG